MTKEEALEGIIFWHKTFFKSIWYRKGVFFQRYVVTQNVESKELVIFCMEAQQPERPKMMDEENVRLHLMVKCILPPTV